MCILVGSKGKYLIIVCVNIFGNEATYYIIYLSVHMCKEHGIIMHYLSFLYLLETKQLTSQLCMCIFKNKATYCIIFHVYF